MGIRMYQEIGLKLEAQEFLEKNAIKVPTSFCPHCNGVLAQGYDVISREYHDSFYGEGPALRKIVLKDESIAEEILQAEPWSSGPVAFFCLKIGDKKMFEWTEKEIEERL